MTAMTTYTDAAMTTYTDASGKKLKETCLSESSLQRMLLGPSTIRPRSKQITLRPTLNKSRLKSDHAMSETWNTRHSYHLLNHSSSGWNVPPHYLDFGPYSKKRSRLGQIMPPVVIIETWNIIIKHSYHSPEYSSSVWDVLSLCQKNLGTILAEEIYKVPSALVVISSLPRGWPAHPPPRAGWIGTLLTVTRQNNINAIFGACMNTVRYPDFKPRYPAPSFYHCQIWLLHERGTTQSSAHLSTETAP